LRAMILLLSSLSSGEQDLSLETAAHLWLACRSEIGNRRPVNEDRLLVQELAGEAMLLAVADGMGGHPGGEVAAQLAVDTLAQWAREASGGALNLVEMIKAANLRILEEGERRPGLRDMGCTLTVALVENACLSWGQVGDSRLYLYREDELRQLTIDQNMAQGLVTAGRLSPEEALVSPYRHILDQCVGCRSCRPASGSLEVRSGDLLLLATDGLHGELVASEIGAILTAAGDPDRATQALVEAALAHGGQDNITVIVAAL
jgi:PPM family protein phosphatase